MNAEDKLYSSTLVNHLIEVPAKMVQILVTIASSYLQGHECMVLHNFLHSNLLKMLEMCLEAC